MQILRERFTLESLIEVGKVLAEGGLIGPQLIGLPHQHTVVRVQENLLPGFGISRPITHPVKEAKAVILNGLL